MNVSVSLKNVSKSYGKQILFSELDLNLGCGKYVLRGPNGVGKSTLIRLISGLESTNKGEVYINHFSVKKERMRVNEIRTYLPDQPAFYENVTVSEMVSVLLSLRKASALEAAKMIEYWQLAPLFPKTWKTLSLGQRKRVFFGVSLLESSPVWILDEPSNGLDREWIPRLAAAVSAHSRNGLVLFSSHDESFIDLVQPIQLHLQRLNGRTEIVCEERLLQ